MTSLARGAVTVVAESASSRGRERVWRPGRPVDLLATLGRMRRGRGDPTWRAPGCGLWRGMLTPEGPATLQLAAPGDGEVRASAWGEGAAWVLEQVPEMLGGGDDPAGFEARHPRVALAERRFPGWRVPRTGLVMESLVPAIIEQKVTGQEAFSGWRRLVRTHGRPAPGPGEALGLWVPPTPRVLARLPSWEWLQLGVSPQRADTVVRAAQVAGRLEECTGLPLPEARRRMRAVPGIGMWTVAETAHRALGDADAVSFGDYHVARNIGWALTGVETDDAGMAGLLQPWAGHRYRVQRLLELNGVAPPRRGPRMAPRTHLPR